MRITILLAFQPAPVSAYAANNCTRKMPSILFHSIVHLQCKHFKDRHLTRILIGYYKTQGSVFAGGKNGSRRKNCSPITFKTKVMGDS